MLDRKNAGKRTRATHDGNEAASFLVSPDRNANRLLGAHGDIVQRAQHLDAGKHTIVAVELAAGGLRVDMASAQDHRRARRATGANGKDVADAVDVDRTT